MGGGVEIVRHEFGSTDCERNKTRCCCLSKKNECRSVVWKSVDLSGVLHYAHEHGHAYAYPLLAAACGIPPSHDDLHTVSCHVTFCLCRFRITGMFYSSVDESDRGCIRWCDAARHGFEWEQRAESKGERDEQQGGREQEWMESGQEEEFEWSREHE